MKSIDVYINEFIIKKKLNTPISFENELAESIYKVFDIDDNELKDYLNLYIKYLILMIMNLKIIFILGYIAAK